MSRALRKTVQRPTFMCDRDLLPVTVRRKNICQKYSVKFDGNTSNNMSILIVVFLKNMVGSLIFF